MPLSSAPPLPPSSSLLLPPLLLLRRLKIRCHIYVRACRRKICATRQPPFCVAPPLLLAPHAARAWPHFERAVLTEAEVNGPRRAESWMTASRKRTWRGFCAADKSTDDAAQQQAAFPDLSVQPLYTLPAAQTASKCCFCLRCARAALSRLQLSAKGALAQVQHSWP